MVCVCARVCVCAILTSTGQSLCCQFLWRLSFYQSGAWPTARAESHVLHASFHVRGFSSSGNGHRGDAIWRRQPVQKAMCCMLHFMCEGSPAVGMDIGEMPFGGDSPCRKPCAACFISCARVLQQWEWTSGRCHLEALPCRKPCAACFISCARVLQQWEWTS